MQPKMDRVRSLLLVEDSCLVIPPYQRPYEWNKDRWQSLIRDIVEAITSKKDSHFIGVAITSESKPDCESAKSQVVHKHVDVIDGQQRLLTLSVWLRAVLDHAKSEGVNLEVGFANVKCQETDVEDWNLIVNGKWIQNYSIHKPESSGLLHAYTYFRWILWLGESALTEQEPDELPKLSRYKAKPASYAELEDFWKDALEARHHSIDENDSTWQLTRSHSPSYQALVQATVDQLSLLVLEVSSQDEDPADIFNALNGQRTEMFQFDHLRNFIFSKVTDPHERSNLYENRWKDTEKQVSKLKIPVKGSSAFDTYLYDLLISMGEKKHQGVSKDKTARQFARYANSSRNSFGQARDLAEKLLLPNLISWASVKQNGNPFEVYDERYELPDAVKSSLVTMDWLSSGPVVPLLLNVVNRFYFEQISEIELKQGIKAVENYLARSVISGAPLSPLRASIMNICGKLGKSYKVGTLVETLREEKVKDAELRKKLLPAKSRPSEPYSEFGQIYSVRNPRQLLAIFQAIERKRSGEYASNLLRTGPDDSLSIDHIFPQSSEKWKIDMKNWEISPAGMDKRIHTIGNLGVVPKSINSKMSNERFESKKEILSRNTFATLSVNQEWEDPKLKQWTTESIDARAEALLDDFLNYYPY